MHRALTTLEEEESASQSPEMFIATAAAAVLFREESGINRPRGAFYGRSSQGWVDTFNLRNCNLGFVHKILPNIG